MASVESALDGTLKGARSFLEAHGDEPAVETTFGYFTRHVVAPLNQKRLGMLLRRIARRSEELGRPLRVLDLACGAGLISAAIAQMGHSVVGVDIDESEIGLAKRFSVASCRGEGAQPPAGFLTVDVMTAPDWEKQIEAALGGKPDGVVLAYALHHLPGVERFVERLAGYLPPEAVLWINEENPLSPTFRLKHLVRTLIQRDTEVEWHRSLGGWSSLLRRHGFVVGRVEGADPFTFLPAGLCWSLVFEAYR